jgi:chromosome segregation ATPase
MVGLMSHRWKDAESRNAALSVQVSSLSEQNGALQQKVKQLSGGNQTIASDLSRTRLENTSEAVQLRGLQDLLAKDDLAIENLQAQLSSSNLQAAGSEQKLRDTQQTLASLNQEVAKLRDSHADDTASLVTQQVQIADLTRQAKESADVIDKEQKLLAVDTDVRNLMAARNLHITDVFDVDGKGTRKRLRSRLLYRRQVADLLRVRSRRAESDRRQAFLPGLGPALGFENIRRQPWDLLRGRSR